MLTTDAAHGFEIFKNKINDIGEDIPIKRNNSSWIINDVTQAIRRKPRANEVRNPPAII